jgi:hypothetical protein
MNNVIVQSDREPEACLEEDVRDITQGPGHITGKGTLELAMV